MNGSFNNSKRYFGDQQWKSFAIFCMISTHIRSVYIVESKSSVYKYYTVSKMMKNIILNMGFTRVRGPSGVHFLPDSQEPFMTGPCQFAALSRTSTPQILPPKMVQFCIHIHMKRYLKNFKSFIVN